MESNPQGTVGAAPHNPLSINIEFNINNSRGNKTDLAHMIRGKKLQSDILTLQKHLCGCQVSKTPEYAQTDREAYSKEMEYLRPVEDRKKKTKRNSMDINAPNKSINETSKTRFSKGNTMILKKVDPSIKQDFSKKKKSIAKNDTQIVRKPTVDSREHKSTFAEVKSEKKATFHKSLKSIIHKIVNNQLSKRTLTGINYSKVKSPYNTNNLSFNNTTRKKIGKKKSLSCKSDRGFGGPSSDRQQIVDKLNSLKSMTNSILRSEMQELQMPYYSKKRGKIHIKTDQSIGFMDEITYYERKTKRSDPKKETINKEAIDETNKLIQTFLQRMYDAPETDKQFSQDLQNRIYSEYHNNQQHQQQSYQKNNQKRLQQIISNQMNYLFNTKKQKFFQENSKSQPYQQAQPTPSSRKKAETQQKLPAYMSSQMQRPATVINQLERMKLQELKKQEIQKWGYLLQFIKKNMNSNQADTETVLSQVYWFLQRSKNDLQKEMHPQFSAEHNKKSLEEDFTVKLSQKRQIKQEYYEANKSQQNSKDHGQQIHSFKEELTEENQDLKLLSLETISNALKHRQQTLDKQRQRQLNILEDKRENGKISNDDYLKQQQKIEKWTRKELNEIKKAKKNIWKGYHEAKGVLQKTMNSKYFEDRQNSNKKMMKCLSQTYLKKQKYDYKKLLQKQQSNKSSYPQSQEKHSQSNEPSEPKYPSQRQQQSYSQHSQNQQHEQNSQQQQQSQQQQHQQHQQHSEQSYHHDEIQSHPQVLQSLKMQKSDQLQPSDQGQLGNSVDSSQQISNSHEMQQIKQRLLRMKRQHYGMQQQDQQQNQQEHEDQQDQQDHNINYQQIQRSLQEQYSDQEINVINNQIGHSFLVNKNQSENKYKQLENKLKYCCSEDKEDMFEFIFLDLCIQLYQEPCKDNKIMKCINQYVRKSKVQQKKKKGIKTNLNVVKQYLKRFIAFLLRTNKNCLQHMNSPMGPTALQMLRYMHESDYDPPEQQEEAPTLIIPVFVFDKFQQSLLPTLEFEEYYDDPDKEEARINFLKTILHIHNKALFDSLNQFLDHERPFGIWGKPFPWKKSSSFVHEFTQAAREQKLKKGIDKVIQQCSYVCGLLVDKQQSLVGNAKISQAYVQQIREDRLSRMLANELVQSQQRWLFYDDEQTQVLVQISSYVWNNILLQVRKEMAVLILHS